MDTQLIAPQSVQPLAQPTAPSSVELSEQPSEQSLARLGQPDTSESLASSVAQRPLSSLAQAHFAILKMGVSIWNRWRSDDPQIIPNLQNADLSGMKLENINFSRANLRGATLDGAYLFDADFQRANLRGASLVRATLIGASLHKANMAETTLEGAYLTHCDFSNANLTGACFYSADLRFALFTDAVLVNARLAAAEMAESYDLTAHQLKTAKDAQLAFVPEEIQALSNADTSQRFTQPPRTKALCEQRENAAIAATKKSQTITSEIVPSIEISFQPRLAS